MRKFGFQCTMCERLMGAETMRRLAITLCLVSGVAQADDLPANLLLRCQGKATTFITSPGNKPDVFEDTFDKTLRLKDRTIGDIRYKFLEGEDCTLEAGAIKCELDAIFPIQPFVNSTEKRHTVVTVDRETGEYHYLLETWGYEGKGTSGKQTSHGRHLFSGTCRPAGGRIF
jgi:hypothetical protein